MKNPCSPSATLSARHAVAFYLDAAAELTVNEPRQPVVWTGADTDHLAVLKLGSQDQRVLARKGDDLRIDWGHFYLAAPRDARTSAHLLPANTARTAFASGTEFPQLQLAMPVASEDAPVAALALPPADVGAQPVSRWLMLAYDDLYSIRYFRDDLRPYWRRNGTHAAELLAQAAADYPALLQRCKDFDAQLLADLRTVDVIFPQAPFFLVLSPALTKAMLVPVLNYAAWPRWPYPYAPHDLGTYPHATGQVYGMGGSDGDRMPVEVCGNMLIMLAALARCESNADFAQPYWPMLKQWADYLVQEGLDPAHPTTWTRWAAQPPNTSGPWAPIRLGPAPREVVPTAQTARVTWRFTFDPPPDDWFQPGFDDSAWREGPAALRHAASTIFSLDLYLVFF